MSTGGQRRAKSPATIPSWLENDRLVHGLFFGALGLCYGLGTHPALHYHLKAQAFFLHPLFLREHLQRPGGALDWLAGLAMQGFVWPWLGAIFALSVCFAVAAGLRRVLSLSSGRPVRVAHLVMIAPVAYLFGVYELPAVEVSLALLCFVWSAVVLWVTLKRRPLSRLLCFGLLCGLLYWFTAEKLVLFGILWAGLEMLAGGRQRVWTVPLPLLLVSLGLWFDQRFDFANPFWTSGKADWLAHPVLAGFLLGAFPLGVAGLHCGMGTLPPSPPVSKPVPGHHRFGLVANICRSPVMLAVVLALATLAPLTVTSQSPSRIFLELDYRARQHEWAKVVALAARLPPERGTVEMGSAMIDTTRALFHLGQLPEALFTLPWKKGSYVLPHTGNGFGWSIAMSELMLELGQVNYAEHWAYEALETKGNRPGLLKCLALAYLAKDQPEAARVYLGLLKTHLLCGRWAADWLDRLNLDPAWRATPELLAIRTVMPKTDLPSAYLPTDALLKQLLAANSGNRMAYAFLMAHYLVSGQTDLLLKKMPRPDAVGYATLPRSYEEALLLSEAAEPSGVDLHGPLIRRATREHFEEFTRQYRELRTDPARARDRLKEQFGDTYWFYLLFGESGASCVHDRTAP